jgi:thiol-disulfide isomerase/thioredoxin
MNAREAGTPGPGPSLGRAAALTAALLLLGPIAVGAVEGSGLAGEVDARDLVRTIAGDRGRVVLVNFWATWCVPCRQEFPDLVRLEKAYRARGLKVIGVSIDVAKDMPAIQKFLTAASPDFPNYRKKSGGDDQDFIEAVDPKWGGELPFSVLYRRDGKKAVTLSGKQSYANFEHALAPLLN